MRCVFHSTASSASETPPTGLFIVQPLKNQVAQCSCLRCELQSSDELGQKLRRATLLGTRDCHFKCRNQIGVEPRLAEHGGGTERNRVIDAVAAWEVEQGDDRCAFGRKLPAESCELVSFTFIQLATIPNAGDCSTESVMHAIAALPKRCVACMAKRIRQQVGSFANGGIDDDRSTRGG